LEQPIDQLFKRAGQVFESTVAFFYNN
jgi:hypothetical protein